MAAKRNHTSAGSDSRLRSAPPEAEWDRWVEYDPKAWPRKVEREYRLVPTVCFNCEAACGLLAYVDRETFEIRKFEGHPNHPASRGRNCAKGPATLDQINDPDRILSPLRRKGARGDGRWEKVSWDHVLDVFAERMHQAFSEHRANDVMYFVGRPGEDGFAERVLETWGSDGHNSHTNVCSSGGRAGFSFWMGTDRPSPDYANARFILLISAHLESGHYFNPHAQRITEARQNGTKVAVIDPRLSNTASTADYWLAAWPGTEGAILLAIARILLEEELYDAAFLRSWVNWRTYLEQRAPGSELTFSNFISELKREYSEYTPKFAERESGVAAQDIVTLAHEIGKAAPAVSTHIWRAAAAGNLHGWQVTRCLWLLNVLTGSVGCRGGVAPNAWHKFIAEGWRKPPANDVWNETSWPPEFPLAHNEMSFLYPHLLLDNRARQAVLFSRVLNPVWTFPDGYSWIRALRDEDRVELHGALTPTWSETAWWSDYVLPMGLGPERHDLHSYETHAGRWIGFRQPVRRVALEAAGRPVEFTYEANPGEVWEEGEFWIELSWRADPDGSLGIRQYYESPYRPGEKIRLDEYYQWIFENAVPGLPERAAAEGMEPLPYMRRHGCFEIDNDRYGRHDDLVESSSVEVDGIERTARRRSSPAERLPLTGSAETVGALVNGEIRRGFNTPSGKLELYSPTLEEWGWPEFTTPTYARSHIHHSLIDHERGEYVLLPTFRLPTLIHSRSGNAKHLLELAHSHPLLTYPGDAERMGIETGDLVRVETEIGYFVIKALVTEGIRPGVVAASHHMGRWRLSEDSGNDRWCSGLVNLEEHDGTMRLRQVHGVQPWESTDPSSRHVWWNDAGVHQNLTFPVHPDPVSGMHCWHQKVRVRRAEAEDQYADVFVDGERARAVYRRWLSLTRPVEHELRRPLWLFRPVKPTADAYKRPTSPGGANMTQGAKEGEPQAMNAFQFAESVNWSPEQVWGASPPRKDPYE